MMGTPSAPSARRRPGVAAGVAALLCIGLAACSGASGQTPAASHSAGPPAASAPAAPATAAGLGTSHPCALLTQSDVTSAIGEPVAAGVESKTAITGLCTYSSVSGDIAGGVLVLSSWSKLIAALHVAKLKQTPVSGIGDEASSVLSQTGAGFPAMVVRKGAIGFEVQVHSPKLLALPDRGLAQDKALATLILSRL